MSSSTITYQQYEQTKQHITISTDEERDNTLMLAWTNNKTTYERTRQHTTVSMNKERDNTLMLVWANNKTQHINEPNNILLSVV